MSVTIDIDGHLYQAASNNGWKALCDWVRTLKGDYPDLKQLCTEGFVAGTDAVAAQLRAGMRELLPPTPVVHTVQGLLNTIGVGAVDETMEVEL